MKKGVAICRSLSTPCGVLDVGVIVIELGGQGHQRVSGKGSLVSGLATPLI